MMRGWTYCHIGPNNEDSDNDKDPDEQDTHIEKRLVLILHSRFDLKNRRRGQSVHQNNIQLPRSRQRQKNDDSLQEEQLVTKSK